jgi:hypothetical protein
MKYEEEETILKHIEAFVDTLNGRYRDYCSDKFLCGVLWRRMCRDSYNDEDRCRAVAAISGDRSATYDAARPIFENLLERHCGVRCNGHHVAQEFGVFMNDALVGQRKSTAADGNADCAIHVPTSPVEPSEKRVGICFGPAFTLAAELVRLELENATIKFPLWPTDLLHALTVLQEEVGELSQASLQLVYEPDKSSRAAVLKEVIQVAAMALRFTASIYRYEHTPSSQHGQNVAVGPQ